MGHANFLQNPMEPMTSSTAGLLFPYIFKGHLYQKNSQSLEDTQIGYTSHQTASAQYTTSTSFSCIHQHRFFVGRHVGHLVHLHVLPLWYHLRTGVYQCPAGTWYPTRTRFFSESSVISEIKALSLIPPWSHFWWLEHRPVSFLYHIFFT